MLSLKEKLGNVGELGSIALPVKPYRLEKVVEEARLALGDVTPKEPAAYDLAETYRVLLEACNGLSRLNDVPARHFRRAPWVLFQPPLEGGQILADNEYFLKAYIAKLRERSSAPVILTLATVFLRYYPRDAAYFNYLVTKLRDTLEPLTTTRAVAFKGKCKEFHLLNADGPKFVARRMLESAEPDVIAVNAGLVGPLEQQGFIEEASEQLLNQLTETLRRNQVEEGVLPQLLGYFISTHEAGHNLRFPKLRINLAESLLHPFSSQEPTPDIKAAISEFLLAHYNDPRLDRANWHGVSNEALTVMMRWLVSATLEDFFKVVSKGSKKERDADRMWPYRRAFWAAYLKSGYITDAWVVLGDEIAREARSFLKEQADAYGRLNRGGGVLPSHAVLMMRIGDLIITEWNYMGKYRVWDAGKENAPKFYLKRYQRDRLVSGPDFDGSHHGAPHGTWQNTLSNLISAQTGIKVNAREYMPR